MSVSPPRPPLNGKVHSEDVHERRPEPPPQAVTHWEVVDSTGQKYSFRDVIDSGWGDFGWRAIRSSGMTVRFWHPASVIQVEPPSSLEATTLPEQHWGRWSVIQVEPPSSLEAPPIPQKPA